MTESSPTYGGPAFRVTPDAQELAYIGLFTVVWGQIDFLMGACLAKLANCDYGGAFVLMEGMTSGPRLNLFLRLAKDHVEDESILKDIKKFHADASAVLEKRNHVVHGIFGYYSDSNDKPPRAAAFFVKKPKEPLFTSELLDLIDKAKALSHLLNSVAHRLLPIGQWKPHEPEDFFFGPVQPGGLSWREF